MAPNRTVADLGLRPRGSVPLPETTSSEAVKKSAGLAGLTDESVLSHIAFEGLQRGGAGASACQPISSHASQANGFRNSAEPRGHGTGAMTARYCSFATGPLPHGRGSVRNRERERAARQCHQITRSQTWPASTGLWTAGRARADSCHEAPQYDWGIGGPGFCRGVLRIAFGCTATRPALFQRRRHLPRWRRAHAPRPRRSIATSSPAWGRAVSGCSLPPFRVFGLTMWAGRVVVIFDFALQCALVFWLTARLAGRRAAWGT